MKINELKQNPRNPQKYEPDDIERLANSIQSFPKMMKLRPIVYDPVTMYVLGGNKRFLALQKLGYKEIPDEWVKSADELTEEEKHRFIVQDNLQVGEFNFEILSEDYDKDEVEEWGLSWEEEPETAQAGKLSDRFIIPPFSVLDTKQEIWQDRKRWWISLGIKSEMGRDENKLGLENVKGYNYPYKENYSISTGTSIFDPVLCELAYKWFNISNGSILDPFAGGSVRGIVAAYLGYDYVGNDLSKKQIEANKLNAKEVLKDNGKYPTWTNGDSRNIDKLCTRNYDMIFSCPPYVDLEVYSDDEADISNMDYQSFLIAYNEIIEKSCKMLNNNRFAVFVVSDVRDKHGFYRNFISDTVTAFKNSGANLYNELILVNSIGNLPMRVAKYFVNRKVGRHHQNVLVFYKGDPKKIRENYKELDLSYINNEQ